jgi:hypothetical protein
MLNILDKDGVVIQQSKNLRGIKRFVAKPENIIKTLDISQVSDGGLLSILFENGDSYQASFNSFTVLKSFVYGWEDVYGAFFTVNGSAVGVVESNNPVLIGSPDIFNEE